MELLHILATRFRGLAVYRRDGAIGLAALVMIGNTSWADPRLPGGATTTARKDSWALGQPAANMPDDAKLEFSVGKSFFRNPWVLAPSTTDARDGLGPLFNTNACINCHPKNGRGAVPGPGADPVALLVRVSIPTANNAQAQLPAGVSPEPTYGSQLQNRAIPGVAAAAKIRIDYEPVHYTYPDDTRVQLRKPKLTISDLAYGPLHPAAQFSLRLAPSLAGLGLLEAVAEASLAGLEDPEDRNNDGISGRRNRVWSIATNSWQTGRFGWKAAQPSVRQQNAAAFAQDLGISNSLMQPSCPNSPQAQPCREAAFGGNPELTEPIARKVELFVANLAVPAPRPTANSVVSAGTQLFKQLQCSACHIPELVTGPKPDMPWLAQQIIHPYTDLLLHDLGEGLADNRSEFAASGREWRTAPLWGIGLAKQINPQLGFLHDGRARTLEEAILWHDGEAAGARTGFSRLPRQQRHLLLQYLEQL